MSNNSELSTLLAAMFDGEMTDAQQTRLADLLRDNPQAQEVYLDFCWTHALLRRELGVSGEVPFTAAGITQSPEGREYLGCGVRDSGRDVGAAVELLHQPESRIPGPDSPLPFPPLSPLPSPLSPPFVGGPIFSYLVATLILGLMLLGAWAYKISHVQQQIVHQDSPANRSIDGPEWVVGGRITGMAACQWSDPSTQTYLGASVPLGRRFALSSGLLEITYKTGAKVILEGPCTYQVESLAGGYLGLGKLTARVEKSEERTAKSEPGGPAASTASGKPQAAIQKSPSSFILHPSSLFFVRTPTALVTDLGTEFGVEVGKAGDTVSFVFRGSVRVQTAVEDHLPFPAGERPGARVALYCRRRIGALEKENQAGGSDHNRRRSRLRAEVRPPHRATAPRDRPAGHRRRRRRNRQPSRRGHRPALRHSATSIFFTGRRRR